MGEEVVCAGVERWKKRQKVVPKVCDPSDPMQIWFQDGKAICAIDENKGRQWCWESKSNPETRPRTVILYELKNKVSRNGKFTFHENSGHLQVGNYEDARLTLI